MPDATLTVLLVEDETSLAEACRTVLERRGYRILRTGAADDAIAAIRSEPRIDILIADLQIPLGNGTAVSPNEPDGGRWAGLAVASEFRRTFRRAPIIVWTYCQDARVYSRVEALGNARLVDKRSGWEPVEELVAESLTGYRSGKRPRVFVVHGHDEQTVREVVAFIETELRFPAPVVLRNLRTRNQTLIEKLEDYARQIDLVFVLLTPDDSLVDGKGTVSLRPRQNVVFELGYFLGLLGRSTGRVVILYRRPVELPSNLVGIVCIDISDGMEAARAEICQEVREWLR
ncbi:MAG: nucleotide-binding protein [Lentisphaeria bacterium]|nr:nucleotide-binding protein [Lentisphaeria bacterium]